MHAESDTALHLLADACALRRLARSLLDEGEVDDALQDAALAALELDPPPRQAGPWLRGLLRNMAMMRRRSQARRRARERAVARPVVDAGSDPAAITAQAELMQQVATAVRELDEPFRTVVVLRFWRGMLPEAIAAELGVPRNTVRSRLQRGIERLRARLDRTHGSRRGWTAPLGAMLGWHSAAPTATATATMTLIAGMLMNTKLLLTAGVLLVAAVAIPWSLAPAHPAAPPMASAAQAPGAAIADASEPPVQRVELPTSSAAKANAIAADEGPFDPSPVHVEPWAPDLLVVDEDDNPVADASVEVFAGLKVERSADVRQRHGGPRHAYQGHAPEPSLTVRTDTDGRARPVLEIENYSFAAHKDGVGQSREEICWHTRTTCLKLVLCGTTTLRGTVLRADGLPAAGAEVTAGPSWSPSTQLPATPVQSDADGRFELQLRGRGTWSVGARLAGIRTFGEHVLVRDATPADVVLVFPGAYTISGTVVDAAAQPVAHATVSLWREYLPHVEDPGEVDTESNRVETDDAGHFTVDVQRLARYQLVASGEGMAHGAPLWTATTSTLPHVEVRLQLRDLATIRGCVVHGDGAPLPGVKVYCTTEAHVVPEHGFGPTTPDLFPFVRAQKTADDGSFTLRVHPDCSWTLVACPVASNPRLGTTTRGIVPGRDDVVLTITDEDLAGCVVRGSIVSAADGAPVEGQNIQLITYGDGDRPISTGGCGAKVDGNFFTLPALPLGERFALRVSAPMHTDFLSGPFAPTDYGPFTTGRHGLEVEVRMQPWGDLPVRVLAADGSVPRDVSVLAFSDQLAVSYPSLHLEAEGRVLLGRRMPGLQHLRVFAGGDRLLLEQDVTIQPGRNPELEVRLPAPSRSPDKR